MAKSRKSGSSWGRFLLGFVMGLVISAGCVTAYLKLGAKPIAIAVKPLPLDESSERSVAERNVAPPSPARKPRIEHEVKSAPFSTSEDVFEAGAHVYRNQCASCHGTPGRDVAFAKYMDPAAPQLWKKHGKGNVVGVSDDEAGETYWKVANGISQAGMPAYQHLLNETQMWQVSLLLKNADQQLPDPVMRILGAGK